jgi:ribosomal protein S18 acetylase RimI-like enzyme
MPELADKDHIRAILRREPAWTVYALGDLSPRMFDKCRWYTPDLTLILRDYGTTILFATGPGSIREAMRDVTGAVHLQVRSDALEEVAAIAAVTAQKLMWRMVWRPAPLPAADPRVAALDAADVAALERLYADGAATGESPDFFYPSMVSDGVFRGIYEGDALVAVAGTHLVSREEGAAAIGNVYTRRDRRGRGLSRAVTTAVLQELAGIETIGLNVRAGNDAAIRVYESLGFARHCEFHEAIAFIREPVSIAPVRTQTSSGE